MYSKGSSEVEDLFHCVLNTEEMDGWFDVANI